MVLADSTLVLPQNTTDFSYFAAPTAATPITVAAASLTNNTRNFLELQLTTVDSTPLSKVFWDSTVNSGAGAEFSQVVNTVTDLVVTVSVLTTAFSGSVDALPLAILDVDNGGLITSIFDRRDLFGRLAKPGNLANEFSWGTKVDPVFSLTLTGVTGTFVAGEALTIGGETATVVTGGTTSITFNKVSGVNFFPGTSSATGGTSAATGTVATFTESFVGVDKNIHTVEDAVKALMTEMKKIKGTTAWYDAAVTDLTSLRASTDSYVVGGGTSSAQTAIFSTPFAALVDGMRVSLRPVAASTKAGGTTFKLDALAVKTVVKYGEGGTLTLEDNDMRLNSPAILTYSSGLDQWVLENPTTSPTTSSTNKFTALQLTDAINYVVGGGTANALTATFPTPFTLLVDGMSVKVRPVATNLSETVTLKVDGTAATPVKVESGGVFGNPQPGDLRIGSPSIFSYNTLNSNWVLLNPVLTTTPNVKLASGYTDLTTAISTIAAVVTSLVISDTEVVTANLTVPGNITLIRSGNGQINPNSGILVTIDGPVTNTTNGQFFGGAGTIVFGPSSVQTILPQWWGAKGDKVTEDTTAIQAAINAFYNADATLNSGIVFLMPGSYMVDPTVGLVLKDNIRLVGSGFGSTEIIPTSTSATARTGFTDGMIRRPFAASTGNERNQFNYIAGIRFVIRGNSQTMINISHMGRTLVENFRITPQDRVQEFSNLPSTIFTSSKGVVCGVADSVPNGYVGGEVVNIRNGIVEFMSTGIQCDGPIHGVTIDQMDIQEGQTLISVPSTGSTGGRITNSTLQNVRAPGAGYCIDIAGANWLVDGNYFEPTSAAAGGILFRTGSRGNVERHNRFDTTVTPVVDNGDGNRYSNLDKQVSRECGQAQGICLWRGARITTDQALATTISNTQLIFNSRTEGRVNNSDAGSQLLEGTPEADGSYLAPFNGMFTVSLGLLISADLTQDIDVFIKVNSLVVKKARILTKATTSDFIAPSFTVKALKGQSIAVGMNPITATLTTFLLKADPLTTIDILGISSS